MTVETFPFGEIDKERFELSKKYSLIEQTAGFWRLTQKCRDNYDAIEYIKYLQGKIERPTRINKEEIINEILNF